MAEDNKSVPGPVAGDDLVSKIAKVYRRLPAEQQARPTEAPSDIENSELDKTFENMVQMYKARPPEVGNGPVAAPAARASTQLRREPAGGYVCPQCGHKNPSANQFCGMCGAAREGAVVKPSPAAVQPQPLGRGLSVSESQVKHLHHHYHHYHYRKIAYVLGAIVLLLMAVIGWQQGREHRKVITAPLPATAEQPQSPVPAQAQPGPTPAPPAAVSVPAEDVKPPRKPAMRSPKIAPRARATVAQPSKPVNGEAAPVLASPPMPKLQEFSHTPPPFASERR